MQGSSLGAASAKEFFPFLVFSKHLEAILFFYPGCTLKGANGIKQTFLKKIYKITNNKTLYRDDKK